MTLSYVPAALEHATQLAALELKAFPSVDPVSLYTRDDIVWTIENFPEGGFAVLDGDTVVGMGMGILKNFDFEHPEHPLEGAYTDHSAEGDWYYGTTIAVDPAYRGRGIGAELYILRKKVVRDLNKRGIVAGGVLPGYAAHIDAMSATDYIAKVNAGELYDPTLTFQIANGFEAVCVLPNYLNDPSVGGNAVLIRWTNPDHQP